MQRNKFIRSFSIGAVSLSFPLSSSGQTKKPDQLNATLVNEFVRVAHFDLKKVKEMLEKHPLLLNASWDWGGGDFETSIGAAGHMGLKDTAQYLLEKGSRCDIFVLAMLGKTKIVTSLLDAYPLLLHSLGPHGYTLLHHAEKGGEEAKELYEYLLSLGLKEKNNKLY